MTGESLSDYQKELALKHIKPAGDVKRFESLLYIANVTQEALDGSIEELRALRRRIYQCDQQLSKMKQGEYQAVRCNRHL
jgi:hypothetical protein